MAKLDTYICDGCQRQKTASNHWFKAYKLNGVVGVVIVSWEVFEVSDRLELSADGEAHLCGADCVTQWTSKNLLGGGQ
jgi:hypothetical protein